MFSISVRPRRLPLVSLLAYNKLNALDGPDPKPSRQRLEPFDLHAYGLMYVVVGIELGEEVPEIVDGDLISLTLPERLVACRRSGSRPTGNASCLRDH
jgi:hypothetical protein